MWTVAILTWAAPLLAASYGTGATDLWKSPANPRFASLSSAVSTRSDDASTIWANPASIAELAGTELSFATHVSLAGVATQQLTVAATRARGGKYAAQLTYRSVDVDNGSQL